ncbi:aryl sulfotransferase [Buttiauxella sp. B2]|uniref:aryl-sulfate sulfotransferase n=1 Tax=Buttiauxella sp. B2 TaxID=2587812 RepID=UPI001121FDDD|nr:aryl-sulfate sulfotransferase [Buttiauxella sp. B2]TNV19779.1 aryl sulfotransferase [Buttiauxella sp. B2]
MMLSTPPLPNPRTAINQGIDPEDSLVVAHTQVYDNLLADISTFITQENPNITLDPYGTAPLSLYIGLWSETAEIVNITVVDENLLAPALNFTQEISVGVNLIPVAGLLPDTINIITLESSLGVNNYSTLTKPLPPTDAQDPLGYDLFPQITLKKPVDNPATLADGLYFISCFDRNNLALDYNANVRWFTVKDIPSNNLLRIANGHFLSSAVAQDNYLKMYEFDMIGRIHTMYLLDNALHHSLYQQSNGLLTGASEYALGTRPDGGTSLEDGVSLIDLNTGLETAYYDMAKVLDISRATRPSNAPSTDGSIDWLHINQCYINETNNILVTSGRNQSAVFGVDVATSILRFIMGTHEAWASDYLDYLLIPVDGTGTPLYDFTDPNDVNEANQVFWNWGQHNVLEIHNDAANILEISIINNGNYRSRDDALSIAPWNNQSRIGHYRIDLNTMTVQLLSEYESGSEGYSSLCGAKQIMSNGNIVVCFGGATFDGTGLAFTCDPGFSDVDYAVWDGSAEGKLPLREMDAEGNILVDITVGSGLARTAADSNMYRYNITCFRAYKLPLFG